MLVKLKIALICGSIFLVSCGGGGGGSSESSGTSDFSSTSTNQLRREFSQLAEDFYLGLGGNTTPFNSFSQAETEEITPFLLNELGLNFYSDNGATVNNFQKSGSTDSAISAVDATIFSSLFAKQPELKKSAYEGASKITVNETVNCDLPSGSLMLTGELEDDATGVLDVEYRNCTLAGVFFDGQGVIEFSDDQFDTGAMYFDEVFVLFVDFEIGAQIAGWIEFRDLNSSRPEQILNYAIDYASENLSGVFYEDTLVVGDGFSGMSIQGSVSFAEFGQLDVMTPNELLIDFDTAEVLQGSVTFESSQGDALNIEFGDLPLLQLDENGDGVFELAKYYTVNEFSDTSGFVDSSMITAPPEITYLSIFPEGGVDLATAKTAIESAYDVFDADTPSLEIEFIWIRNGLVIVNQSSDSLPAGIAVGDDEIRVVLVASDGVTKVEATSEQILLLNLPPELVVGEFPSTVTTSDEWVIDIGIVDPDGEAVPEGQYEISYGPVGMYLENEQIKWSPGTELYFGEPKQINFAITHMAAPGVLEQQVTLEFDREIEIIARDSIKTPRQIESIKVANVYGDAKLEVIVLSESRQLQVLQQSGDGLELLWQMSQPLESRIESWFVTETDMDADGLQEILFYIEGDSTAYEIEVFGELTSIPIDTSSSPIWGGDILLEDLTGDGFPEILDSFSRNLSVYDWLSGDLLWTTERPLQESDDLLEDIRLTDAARYQLVGNVDSDDSLELFYASGLILDIETQIWSETGRTYQVPSLHLYDWDEDGKQELFELKDSDSPGFNVIDLSTQNVIFECETIGSLDFTLIDIDDDNQKEAVFRSDSGSGIYSVEIHDTDCNETLLFESSDNYWASFTAADISSDGIDQFLGINIDLTSPHNFARLVLADALNDISWVNRPDTFLYSSYLGLGLEAGDTGLEAYATNNVGFEVISTTDITTTALDAAAGADRVIGLLDWDKDDSPEYLTMNNFPRSFKVHDSVSGLSEFEFSLGLETPGLFLYDFGLYDIIGDEVPELVFIASYGLEDRYRLKVWDLVTGAEVDIGLNDVSAASYAVGDLNGDDRNDIAVSDAFSESLSIYVVSGESFQFENQIAFNKSGRFFTIFEQKIFAEIFVEESGQDQIAVLNGELEIISTWEWPFSWNTGAYAFESDEDSGRSNFLFYGSTSQADPSGINKLWSADLLTGNVVWEGGAFSADTNLIGGSIFYQRDTEGVPGVLISDHQGVLFLH